jgi:hypothetical protein
MTFQLTDFTSKLDLIGAIHNANPNRAAELNAIASALNPDATTHDTTLSTAPAGLQPGNPANSRFTNDVLLLVNKGKGGNLTPLQMSNAITAELSKIFPPVQTSPPVISGTGTVGQMLSSTVGNWTYVPTSYAYQWRRGAINIPGATSSTYVLQAADSGTNITMQLTAINAAGATAATLSNAIAVT